MANRCAQSNPGPVLLFTVKPSSSLPDAQNLRRRVRNPRTLAFLTPYRHFSIEFLQICKAVAVGFAVMGFIGYLVKLIHIPM
jgi:hypothetical protein